MTCPTLKKETTMTISTPFDVMQHTRAPLRLELTARFHVSPQKLFDTVSDHHAVANWVPLMRAVAMEHKSNGQCDVGSIRHCSLHGMGGIDETILWWNPPHGYAFRVEAKSKMMMPTRDHVSVMLIVPTADGGCELTWRHHFNWRGFFMRHMTAVMFPMMMRSALANIRKELGEDCAANHACAASTCQKAGCK
ncbi:MAG: hypothetical protein CVU15_00270 [Betaproteobacteria bacterium HGW-Betaproteobacteria-1]|jgi:uncharacterized protein YndB with AHSA1/START domain|nr:MAG: hypothetical protein CVU15_00270 [Betaproteobacteria bacterium HGW-Betaproteobacteria-1]